MEEGWADKLKEQSHEGCNIAGRLRVNKVAGNIHLSPGRSFQASNYQNVYELVPYLKEEGVRHDFSHTIHQLKFTADDEYDLRKSSITKTLMAKMGVVDHPLDNTDWMVRFLITYYPPFPTKSRFSRPRRTTSCSNTSSRLSPLNSGPSVDG